LDRDAEKGRTAAALAQALAALLCDPETMDDLIAVAEAREASPEGPARAEAAHDDV
jgi:hypothetical protein